MAKQRFTHTQSIQSVLGAIEAIASGEPEEVCLQKAMQAVNTVPNSNSMIVAALTDQAIADQGLELPDAPDGPIAQTLLAAQDHVNAIEGEVVVPPPALPEPTF